MDVVVLKKKSSDAEVVAVLTKGDQVVILEDKEEVTHFVAPIDPSLTNLIMALPLAVRTLPHLCVVSTHCVPNRVVYATRASIARIKSAFMAA